MPHASAGQDWELPPLAGIGDQVARAGLEPGSEGWSPEEDIFSFTRLPCHLGGAQPEAFASLKDLEC